MTSSNSLTLWGYSSGRQKLREANRTEILRSQDYLYKTKSSTFGAENKHSRMPAQISHAGKNADIAAALKKKKSILQPKFVAQALQYYQNYIQLKKK